MKVVLLAVDDEFAGLMQQHLYRCHPEWIVGSVISTSVMHQKSSWEAALYVMRHSGVVYLARMAHMKIVRKLLNNGDTPLPSAFARRHNVEEYRTENINGTECLSKLRSWAPDLMISTNFSQYVGRQAREIPSVGAWNLHKSYLPYYRGMAPSFHALLEEAPFAGATLHVMSKGFDTGDILTQVKVPIDRGDTVYELNKRTADAGGRLLVEFLQDLDPGRITAVPQPPGDWRSYTYPTRADLRAFRSKGHRF